MADIFLDLIDIFNIYNPIQDNKNQIVLENSGEISNLLLKLFHIQLPNDKTITYLFKYKNNRFERTPITFEKQENSYGIEISLTPDPNVIGFHGISPVFMLKQNIFENRNYLFLPVEVKSVIGFIIFEIKSKNCYFLRISSFNFINIILSDYCQTLGFKRIEIVDSPTNNIFIIFLILSLVNMTGLHPGIFSQLLKGLNSQQKQKILYQFKRFINDGRYFQLVSPLSIDQQEDIKNYLSHVEYQENKVESFQENLFSREILEIDQMRLRSEDCMIKINRNTLIENLKSCGDFLFSRFYPFIPYDQYIILEKSRLNLIEKSDELTAVKILQHLTGQKHLPNNFQLSLYYDTEYRNIGHFKRSYMLSIETFDDKNFHCIFLEPKSMIEYLSNEEDNIVYVLLAIRNLRAKFAHITSIMFDKLRKEMIFLDSNVKSYNEVNSILDIYSKSIGFRYIIPNFDQSLNRHGIDCYSLTFITIYLLKSSPHLGYLDIYKILGKLTSSQFRTIISIFTYFMSQLVKSL